MEATPCGAATDACALLRQHVGRLAMSGDLRESLIPAHRGLGNLPKLEKTMPLKYLTTAAFFAVLALSGCASTGDANTTYAQWQGPNPVPDPSASSPGGFRLSY
ncbi:hypothetical protein [Ensifer sp.]|uniref:hypothetical protein n=1 Tax=Ensifer sp. TaxID=1872086 RepID=UPI00289AD1DD|nr:hypothetical protein [Ensifer sp.]